MKTDIQIDQAKKLHQQGQRTPQPSFAAPESTGRHRRGIYQPTKRRTRRVRVQTNRCQRLGRTSHTRPRH